MIMKKRVNSKLDKFIIKIYNYTINMLKECFNMSKKVKELSDDEMKVVTGGLDHPNYFEIDENGNLRNITTTENIYNFNNKTSINK